MEGSHNLSKNVKVTKNVEGSNFLIMKNKFFHESFK
jgi:hypothetical protein